MGLVVHKFAVTYFFISLFSATVRLQCECIHGVCEGDSCSCYAQFTGATCEQAYCGNGFCEVGQACIAGSQCCSDVECKAPLALPQKLKGDNQGLPAVAYVGIACIVLMIGAMVAAVVIAKLRCGIFQRNGDSTMLPEHVPSEKPDGISTFKPAEDVTSIDIVADITNTWTRTDSNAQLEAEGIPIPYRSESGESEAADRFAWEEPEEKMAKADADLKELKAAESRKSAVSHKSEASHTATNKSTDRQAEKPGGKSRENLPEKPGEKSSEKPKKKGGADSPRPSSGGKRKASKK